MRSNVAIDEPWAALLECRDFKWHIGVYPVCCIPFELDLHSTVIPCWMAHGFHRFGVPERDREIRRVLAEMY